jgi:hypothetical protein
MAAFLAKEAPAYCFNFTNDFACGEWHLLVRGSGEFGLADRGDLDEGVGDAGAG